MKFPIALQQHNEALATMTSLGYRNLADGTILFAIETQYSALKRLCHKLLYYLHASGEIVVNFLLHTPCNGDKHKKRRLFLYPIDIIDGLAEEGGKTPGKVWSGDVRRGILKFQAAKLRL